MIGELIADLGEDPEATLVRARKSAENKAALKAACAEAKTLGLPGAPCCVTADGEVFWGNDRLERRSTGRARLGAFARRLTLHRRCPQARIARRRSPSR